MTSAAALCNLRDSGSSCALAQPIRSFRPRPSEAHMDTTAELPSCRCSRCWGFAEWCIQNLGHDYGLPRSPGCGRNDPVRLSVQTIGPTPDNVVKLPTPRACDGSMCCPCERCCAERAERVRQGGQDAGPSQIRPRPPRALRGAAA